MSDSEWVSGDRPWFRQYDPNVPYHVSVPDRLLHDLIGDSVRKWPDRTALLYYGASWTYARFWKEAGAFAAALYREGVRAGDRVALYLPNCPEYPIAYYAILRLGATVAQVSPLYIGQDLVRLLKDAQPKALVTLHILYPNLEKISNEYALPVTYVAHLKEFYRAHLRPFVNLVLRRRGLPTAYLSGPDVRPWTRTVRTPGEFPAPHQDPATTVAVLQYTGGTTGTPKAAMLTHRNLVANAWQAHAWFAPYQMDHEVVLATVPFFHVYGMTVALNYPLMDGATIIMQTRPDIPELLKLIDKYHPSQFPGVPALYQGIINYPKLKRFDLRSIKVCLSGSAPLPQETARRFEEMTGGHLVEGYGLSEASPATHVNPIKGERRLGSIGIPLPETDQRVVDLDTSAKEVPTGEIGELEVRGPQVMLGYYHRPEETSAFLRGGWLRTGDVARIDADGYAYIVDRKKDMIIVGGFKVYPREVEEVLFQHPAVADAAAIGVPDVNHGEVVHAFVVVRPNTSVTETDLIAFVRERIAHYKAPRAIEFRTELPRSGIQKVLRRVLREDAARPVAGGAPTDPVR